MFNEVKQRPLYIVRTVLNKDMQKDGENANEQIGANAEYSS